VAGCGEHGLWSGRLWLVVDAMAKEGRSRCYDHGAARPDEHHGSGQQTDDEQDQGNHKATE